MATEKETIEEYKTRQVEAKLKLAQIQKKPSSSKGFSLAPAPSRRLAAPNVTLPMSKGQQMLAELFSGREEPLWGTGNNLPVLNNSLNSGGGLIKNGDKMRRTGGMFGLR